MKIVHRRDYRRSRLPEYPPIGDQLEAIWSLLATQKNLPDDVKAILEQIAAVKVKYPKPP